MKKRIIFLVLAFSFVLNMCSKQKQDVKKFKGVIVQATGKVTINGNSAKRGSIVRYNDLIETAKSSSCIIIFVKNNIFQLKENGSMRFKINKQENTVIVNRGIFAGVSKEKFVHQDEYLITTPTAVAGIRGTAFCMNVLNANDTYFCVCNGVINLKGNAQGLTGTNVANKHHGAKRFIKQEDGTLKVVENAGLHYHGDAWIEKLAKRINVTVDWTKVSH